MVFLLFGSGSVEGVFVNVPDDWRREQVESYFQKHYKDASLKCTKVPKTTVPQIVLEQRKITQAKPKPKPVDDEHQEVEIEVGGDEESVVVEHFEDEEEHP